MRKLLPLLAMLAVFSGCSTSTSQRVGVGAEAYITTTNSMSVLARSGNLDLSAAETFETYRAPAKGYLDIALEDLLDGDEDDSQAERALDLLIPLLDQMIAANKEAKDNE